MKMLTNRLQRRRTGGQQRGRKYGSDGVIDASSDEHQHLEDVDKTTKTASGSTQRDADSNEFEENFFWEKMAEVRVILIVMDALLVMHRRSIY